MKIYSVYESEKVKSIYRIMIKLKLSLIAFLLSFNYSFSQPHEIKKGVLRISLPKFGYTDKINLYNEDGSLFATVFKDQKDDEYRIKNINEKIDDSLLNKIRACYLTYGLIIFDTDSSIISGKIVVYVGGRKKLMETKSIQKFVVYQNWPVFLKGLILHPAKGQFVYHDTLTLNKHIPGAEKLGFLIKRIWNDWIYVECAKTCEECPGNKMIRGWIRWRNGNQLLVDLFYFC